MEEKASFSEIQRAQIFILHNESLSQRNIYNKVSCSKTTVHQVIVNFKNYGIYTNKNRSGRPGKTVPLNDNLMWRIAVWSRNSSCKKIHSAFLLKGPNVHRLTVSNRLVHDFKLKACKPAPPPKKKTSFNRSQKAKRINFVKKYENWDEAN